MPRLNGSQSTRIFQWKSQLGLERDLLPPVLNAWNDLLPLLGGGVKVVYLRFYQTNDEVAAKDVEVEVTRDGLAPFVSTVALANAAYNYAFPEHTLIGAAGIELGFLTGAGEPWTFSWATGLPSFGELFTAHSLGIRFRMITALGTNQRLLVNLEYMRWMEL